MPDDTDVEIWLDEFLNDLINKAGWDLWVEEMNLSDEDHLVVQLAGPDSALVIGREGVGLDALQHLIASAAAHNGKSGRRLVVDVEHYRERREQRVREEASRLATEVLDSGEMREMEPMSPRERRLVHMVVASLDGVTTESLGQGSERYVRMVPAPE